MIGEWNEEKKAYVLYNVGKSAFGRSVLYEVMQAVVNNDTDICVCATCYLKAYVEIGDKHGVNVVEYWAKEYDLYKDQL